MEAHSAILALFAWEYTLSTCPTGIISEYTGWRLIRVNVCANWTVSQASKLIPKETFFTAEAISMTIHTGFALVGTLKTLSACINFLINICAEIGRRTDRNTSKVQIIVVQGTYCTIFITCALQALRWARCASLYLVFVLCHVFYLIVSDWARAYTFEIEQN